MDETGESRRAIAPLLTAAAAAACLVGAVVAFVVPMTVSTRLIEGVAVPCGSLLDPVAAPYYCDDAQSARIGVVIGLLVLAAALGAVAYVLGAKDRANAWRALGWSAWPVVYALTVVVAWVITYPYVQTRDGISGLEFMLQVLVASPLGWFTPTAATSGQDTVVLLLAGLVQVALVAALCRWGFVRSRDRARGVRENPMGPAPVT